MRRFNTPPGWPPAPTARWRPPRGWMPDDAWPPAPPGWAFWINEHGRRVTGPIGRYGGPSRLWPVAGVLLIGALLVGAGQLAGGSGPNESASVATPFATSAAPPVTLSSATPGSPTPTAVPGRTGTPVPATPSATPSTSPRPATTPSPATPTRPPVSPSTTAPGGAQVVYRNCGAVRAAGKDPLLRGQPGYTARLDPDGDGVACARGHG